MNFVNRKTIIDTTFFAGWRYESDISLLSQIFHSLGKLGVEGDFLGSLLVAVGIVRKSRISSRQDKCHIDVIAFL